MNGVAVDRCRAGFGGGIDNEGTLDLIDSEITFNSAFAGAGIRAHRGVLTLLRTTVSANFAVRAGGGIAIKLGNVMLQTGANVTGNTAGAGSGGGVANFVDGTLTLVAGSSITSNEAPGTAPGRGRGRGIESAGSTRLEAGSSVTGNTAGGDGGGVFRSGGMVNLANTTIVSNNTVGGAGNNCRPAGKINNCIG